MILAVFTLNVLFWLFASTFAGNKETRMIASVFLLLNVIGISVAIR